MNKHLSICCWIPIIWVCLLLSCGKNDDTGFHFYCPSCNETITWQSYGNFVFKGSGDDSMGWKLKSDCGWSIYNGHEGGYGETLELSSCGSNGVIFVWAYQTFYAFRVAEGWQGKTKEGIGIGDSLTNFLNAYPNFINTGAQEYSYTSGDVQVKAKFDSQDKLEELIVGQYFRY